MSEPCGELELTISASNLQNKDVFSKSDPKCVVSLRETSYLAYEEIGRTEEISNCVNPEWATKIRVQYKFERMQTLRFAIYDIDDDSADLQHHDFLGRAEMTVAEIVSSPGGRLTQSLHGLEGNCGTITVTAEELNATRETLHLKCQGAALDKKKGRLWFLCGKSNPSPFLLFYRITTDGNPQLAYRTEVVKKNRNPLWQPVSIPMRQLTPNGDLDTKFTIRCFDNDKRGSHRLIGSCTVTANELLGNDEKSMLINPDKQHKKSNYQNSGHLLFADCQITRQYSFLDYITSGTKVNFVVAIDFTTSNGFSNEPNSLHHTTSGSPNFYQMALQSVGRICEPYSTNRQFLSMGFGAKLPGSKDASHDFPLTFKPAEPFCTGVDEVLRVYGEAIQQVTLSSPTNFSPVINRMASVARQFQDGQNYFVLLIVTDGQITDLEQTMKAVINASSLPMSIIIVGVGNADCGPMERLDSDDRKLQYDNRTAERDIVQFVPYNRIIGPWSANNNNGFSPMGSQERLADEVMKEVPFQLAEWMNSRYIKPGVPTQPTAFTPMAPPLPYPKAFPTPYPNVILGF